MRTFNPRTFRYHSTSSPHRAERGLEAERGGDARKRRLQLARSGHGDPPFVAVQGFEQQLQQPDELVTCAGAALDGADEQLSDTVVDQPRDHVDVLGLVRVHAKVLAEDKRLRVDHVQFVDVEAQYRVREFGRILILAADLQIS